MLSRKKISQQHQQSRAIKRRRNLTLRDFHSVHLKSSQKEIKSNSLKENGNLKYEKKTFKSLFVSPLCDFVAEYIGFHEVNLKKTVFEPNGLLACSGFICSQFKYMHHNLATENFESVQMYILHCAQLDQVAQNQNFSDYEKFLSEWEEEDQAEGLQQGQDFYESRSAFAPVFRESDVFRLYNKYLFTLVKWATVYGNIQLNQRLCCLPLLENNFQKHTDLWLARFEGCMIKNDVKLFETNFSSFSAVTRPSLQTNLLSRFVQKNYFSAIMETDTRRFFFHAVYQETRLLPITHEILMHALYLNDKPMQEILLRNYEDARVTLMLPDNQDKELEYKLFLAGAFDDIQNMHSTHIKGKIGHRPRPKFGMPTMDTSQQIQKPH